MAVYDTMVIAPTSFGKSLLYLIPALAQGTGITIVIEPLLALIHDQVHKLRKLDISASYLDSTQSKSERRTVIDDLRKCRIKILYVAPERLETGILSLIEMFCQIKIDYSNMKEFYTIDEVCRLFELDKKELQRYCRKYGIEPQEDQYGNWGFRKVLVRRLHNYIYKEQKATGQSTGYRDRKRSDPWG